jgi:arylsulfatase A-like enzyme
VEHLKALGRWQRSVLFVTSDHGFQHGTMAGAVIDLDHRLEAEVRGVRFAPDGGVGHLYAERLPRDATALGDTAAAVDQAAAVARSTAGVAEVLARLPGSESPALDAHARRLAPRPSAHRRAAPRGRAGYQFANAADPALPGNHGRPEDMDVPLFVTGGSPAIVGVKNGAEPPALVDVTPTIAALLGLRLPRRVDGTAIPAADAGRRYDAILAERPDQSPH